MNNDQARKDILDVFTADADKKVTDPSLLKQLNANDNPSPKKIDNPELLKKLNGSDSSSTIDPEDFTVLGAAKNVAVGTGKEMWEGAKDLGSLVTFGAFDKEEPKSKDPEEAFQQGFAKSPGGKALGASRLFPPIAFGSELFKAASPALDYAAGEAGIDPKHIHSAELLLPVLGAKAGPKEIISPKTVAKVTDIIAHPLDNATVALKTGYEKMKSIPGKIEAKRLQSDNPLLGGGLKKSLESPAAKEGERLGKKFGVKFSAGELSGNASAMAHEDALANSARHAEKFVTANEKKTAAVIDKFQNVLNTLHPQSVSRVDVGSKISKAYEDTIDTLVKTRHQNAEVSFGLANDIAEGKPVISPTNFINVLKDFIKEGESPLATPAQREAAIQAKAHLDRLKAEVPKSSGLLDENGNPIKHPTPKEVYKKITIEDLQNGLAMYGEGAYSGKGIWKGLDTASDRRFSKAAKAALQKDMESDVGGMAGEALRIAREKYKLDSNKLSDIEKTTIGKMVGGADHDSAGNLNISPEKMADSFLKMQPTELKNTLQFLDKHNPEVAQMARRYTLETVLHKAFEGKGQRGEGASKPFPKAQFVSSLPDDVHLDAILGKSGAAKDVHDIAAAMNRMIDWGASKKGSATTQRTDILNTLSKWGKGAIYRSLASDSLVEDLLDPTRRKELEADAKKINK